MGRRSNGAAKRVLAHAGMLLPAQAVQGIRVASGYLAVGSWVRERGYSDAPRATSRYQVFDAMLELVRDEPVVYLEFGVFEGASLRYWSAGLRHPDSVLVGFDSFEGLPETFDSAYPMGQFDRGGEPPVIDDDRVSFQVGWFDDTLPQFQVPEGKRLVLVLDADLYSATKLVLETLDERIVEGTLIYFDELSRIDHEPAAFDDYVRKSGKSFAAVALEGTFNTGAFVCLGG